MELYSILSKYFPPGQAEAAIVQWKSLGWYVPLQAATDEFYEHPRAGLCQARAAFVKLINSYMQTAVDYLKPIPCSRSQETVVKKLLKVLAVLMIDAMIVSKTEDACFYDMLRKAAEVHLKVLDQHTWKFYTLLELATQEVVHYKTTAAGEAGVAPAETCAGLRWHPMADDKKNGINSKRYAVDLMNLLPGVGDMYAILALMDTSLQPSRLRMPRCHLEAFMVWHGLMHKCKRLTCSNSRGIYQFLKERMVKVGKQDLPRRSDYRKIKSEALANPETNKYLRTLLQPLFSKYCPGQEFQIIFNDYFVCNQPQPRKTKNTTGR